MGKTEKGVLAVYGAWTGFVLVVCLMRDGLSADNFTRLLIIIWFGASFGNYWRTKERTTSPTRAAFVLKCSLSALVVEFCYMFSRPVFSSLLVVEGTSLPRLLRNTAIDFAFTLPAYLVIFAVVWLLITRFKYRVAEYLILISLGQALGDGNAFFRAQPALLLLAPYVMSNYQAANLVAFLRVRASLTPTRGGVLKYLLPILVLPAVYWVMGACIIAVGRWFGLA